MRFPRLTMDMLTTIVAMVGKTGFAEGGRELGGITSDAARKRLKNAEEIVGGKLFLEHDGILALTELGQIAHEDALLAIEHSLLIEDRIRARLVLRSSRILVGHTTYIAPRLWLAVRRTEFPKDARATIEHRSGLTHSIVEQVVNSTLHVGIGYLPINNSLLQVQELLNEALVVCLYDKHPLSTRHVITPEDLRDEAFIAVSRESKPELHQEISEYFESLGITLKVVADAFGPPEALDDVELRLGISILAPSSVPARRGIVTKPLSTRLLRRRSGIFIRQDNDHPLVRKCVDLFLENTAHLRKASIGKL